MITATNLAQNIDAGLVIDFLSDSFAVVLPEPEYVAPPGLPGRRVKSTPRLPAPLKANEVVIDQAVLRQMEEEREAALMFDKKRQALERVRLMREEVAERRERLARLAVRQNAKSQANTNNSARLFVERSAPRSSSSVTVDYDLLRRLLK